MGQSKHYLTDEIFQIEGIEDYDETMRVVKEYEDMANEMHNEDIACQEIDYGENRINK